MRTYMWVRIWTFLVSIISLVAGTYCHFKNYGLWSNILIGIFSSSLLTYIGALISYKITRKESLLSYLGALQRYRCKFRNYERHCKMPDLSIDTIEGDFQSLREYRYDMHYNVYLKLQHISKKHRMPRNLNRAFILIKNVQEQLDNNNGKLSDKMEYDINEAIEIVEREAIKIKAIKPKNK